MLICRNAEGVRGKQKIGNPWAIQFDANLACYTPYVPAKGQRLDNLPVFSVPWRF